MSVLDSLMELTCRQFSRHISNGEEPLGGGFYRRVQFLVHWAICPFCRRYWKELRGIAYIHRCDSMLVEHPGLKIADVQRRLKEKILPKAS